MPMGNVIYRDTEFFIGHYPISPMGNFAYIRNGQYEGLAVSRKTPTTNNDRII
jgi:hypothetical protein